MSLCGPARLTNLLRFSVRHLPSWFPGWRKMSKHAAYVRSLSEAMRNKPFEQAKERIASLFLLSHTRSC